MKYFLILLVVLFAMAQISADPAPTLKKFKAEKKSGTFITKPLFTGLQFSKGENDFDIVSIKDCPLTDIVGAPQMPVKYMHFLIPPGKDVASIKIKKKSYNLPGKYKIMPTQPPCYPCENWKPLPFVWPDAQYYKYTPVFPEKIAEVVHHGYFDGRARIVTIAVHPLQYITGRDLLVYHDKLSFQFTYRDSGPDDQPLQVWNRKPELQAKYDALLNSLIDNDDKSDLRFYAPSDSTDTGTKPEVMDYLIIAPEEYLGPENYFDDLVKWKRATGLNVRLKSWQSIVADYPNGDQIAGEDSIPDAAGSIRQYLKDQWQNGLVYALLVGDDTVFPVRYGCGYTDNQLPQPPERENWIVPTDLYFAEFNGNWNFDGDEYYGEPYDSNQPDCYSEMFVGRVLVPSIDNGGAHQLDNWMEKLITYETNPGDCRNGGDCAYLTHALYTRSDEMVNSNVIDAQIDALTGWEVVEINESPVEGDLGTPTGSEVINSYNQGNANSGVTGTGLSSFNNHGDVHSVAVSTTDINSHPKHWVFSLDEYKGSTDVTPEVGNGLDNLIPNGKYSINCSMACHIGAYDREAKSKVICMARAFTTYLADKGGPAMIANTRVGGSSTAYMIRDMLRVLFGHTNNNFYPQYPVTNIGVALAGGKNRSFDRTLTYSLNLFGDPEMPIWTKKPEQMVLTYDPEQHSVTVKDCSGAMLLGTKVHFWNDAGNTELTMTNSDGKAKCDNFQFTHVCATRENFLPVEMILNTTLGDRDRLIEINPRAR